MKKHVLTMVGVLALLFTCIKPVSAIDFYLEPTPKINPGLFDTLSAPSNLTAVSENPGTITLKWKDNSIGETGFMIERRMEDTAYSNVGFTAKDVNAWVDSETASMYPIYPGEKYYYRVRAYNDSRESAYSNESWAVVERFAPVTPTNLKAQVIVSIMGHPVQLTWNDNSSDETQFTVQRKREGSAYQTIAELPGNSNEYRDSSDLQEDIRYTYRIQACNNHGCSYSNEDTIEKPSYAPAAPQNFTGIAQGSSSIRLFWTDAADNEDEFWIVNVRNDGTYNPTPDYVLEADSTELIITGLEPETQYRYMIISKNAGFSSFTTDTRVSTGPPAPVNLTAAQVGSALQLTWASNSKYSLSFTIERRIDSGDYVQVAYLTEPEALVYTDYSVTPGQKCTYRIQAWNVWTYSDYSTEVSAVPQSPVNNLQQLEIKLNLGKTSYLVNNQVEQMDTAPVISQDRTMLPIRYITEALGAQVSWEELNRKVTIIMGDKHIELWIDNNTALVNGEEIKIDPDNDDVKPYIAPPGRAMLPLRFIAETLDCQVEWDPVTREVNVIYSK